MATEIVEIPTIEPNVAESSLEASARYSSGGVWAPFHSEVSATGFAKRLSLQLGYPFQVTRDGPARYLVVFDYNTDDERELLLQQIATLTGFRAP